MELDTRELFRCLARDCNYRDEKLCDVSKADCIARDIHMLLSKLRSSWRILKFSEVLHVYLNRNFYVRNHVSQKAKGEILSNWDAIANRETAVQVQVMFSAKQHPDCRHRWPEINCDNADGHSQTGNRKKKCREVEFERQAVRTKVARSAFRLCLHTVDRTFICTNFLLLSIVDLTDIKSSIVFKFS